VKATLHPCPECGTGIVGAHLSRHRGSKLCQRIKARKEYTRAMFDEVAQILAELQRKGMRLAELARELNR
jgi:hypothetical protein